MSSVFITVPPSLQSLIIALVMLNWLYFSLFGEPGFSLFSLSFCNALMNENIYLFIYFWLHRSVCGILVLQPRIEPMHWKQSLNHWPIREVPGAPLIMQIHEREITILI